MSTSGGLAFFLTPARCAVWDESKRSLRRWVGGWRRMRSVLMVTSAVRDAVLILGSVASGNDLEDRRSGPPKGVRESKRPAELDPRRESRPADKNPEREASRRSLPADPVPAKKGFYAGLGLAL